jgi:hypothetical protein
MLYNDYIKRIDEKYKSLLSLINVNYNFDYGDEFEFALCHLLRALLPEKYGVCRGFIVDKESHIAGDDIIIFDQYRFPTIRLFDNMDFSIKQQIPVEAVYAYIEAKHQLDDSTFVKSLTQVRNVKQLIMRRGKLDLSWINDDFKLVGENNLKRENYNFPDYFNPPFTAIISNKCGIAHKDLPDASNLIKMQINLGGYESFPPDLLISDNIVALPAVETQIESPFFSNNSKIEAFTSNYAFGIGMSSLLYALDYIKLGKIHWPSILADSLGLNLK